MAFIVSMDWTEPKGDVNFHGEGTQTADILLLFLGGFQYILRTLDISIQVRLLFSFIIEKMQILLDGPHRRHIGHSANNATKTSRVETPHIPVQEPSFLVLMSECTMLLPVQRMAFSFGLGGIDRSPISDFVVAGKGEWGRWVRPVPLTPKRQMR